MRWQPPLPTPPFPGGTHHCLVPDDRHSLLYAIGSFWDGCEVVFSNGFLRGAEGTVSTSRHLQITTEEGWNKPTVSFAVRQQQRREGYGFPLVPLAAPSSVFSLCTLISTDPQPEDFHLTQHLGSAVSDGDKRPLPCCATHLSMDSILYKRKINSSAPREQVVFVFTKSFLYPLAFRMKKQPAIPASCAGAAPEGRLHSAGSATAHLYRCVNISALSLTEVPTSL